MPYVLLKNLATGEKVWFYNVPQPRRHPRVRLEVAPAGLPDRGRPGRAAAGRRPVDGGRVHRRQERAREVLLLRRRRTRSCTPPTVGPAGNAVATLPPAPLAIDWVIGTSDVRFDNSIAFRDDLVRKTTDHPIVMTDATIAPRTPPDARPTSWWSGRAGPDLARDRRRPDRPAYRRWPDDHRRRLHAQRPHRGRAHDAGRQRGRHAHRPPGRTQPGPGTASAGCTTPSDHRARTRPATT